jgi:hypothetical protein
VDSGACSAVDSAGLLQLETNEISANSETAITNAMHTLNQKFLRREASLLCSSTIEFCDVSGFDLRQAATISPTIGQSKAKM